MDFTIAVSTSLTRSVSITILLLTLIRLPSTTAIDCGGKPFHCENSTHFKICVDFGNGVSSTVDDFVIPCPPGTECRGINHFECEFIPPTTPATIDSPSDVTNDTKVIDDISVTTPMLWEVVTTILPPGSRHDEEFSERYLNTAEPRLGSSIEPTDSVNGTELIITTKLPETVSGTIADIAISENTAELSTNVTTLAPELLYTSTLVINEHDFNMSKSSVTIVPITNDVFNETVQNSHITSASVNKKTIAAATGFTSFRHNNEQESINSTETENVLVTHDSVNKTFQNAEDSKNNIYKIEINTTTTLAPLSTVVVDNGQESYKNGTKTENAPVQHNVQSIFKHEEINNKTLQVKKNTTKTDLQRLDDLAVDIGQETVLSSTTNVNVLVAQENSNQTIQNKEKGNRTHQLEKTTPTAGPEFFDTSAIDNIKTSNSKAKNISFTDNTVNKASRNKENGKHSTYNVEIRTSTQNPELMNTLAVASGQNIFINTITTENVLISNVIRSQESADKTSQNVDEIYINNLAIGSGLEGVRSRATIENILIAQDSSTPILQNEKEGNEAHQLEKLKSTTDPELFETIAIDHGKNLVGSSKAENISVTQDRLNETLQNEESSNSIIYTTEKMSPTGEAGITNSTKEENISITIESINKYPKSKELTNSTTAQVKIEKSRTSDFLITLAADNEPNTVISSTRTELMSVNQVKVNKTVQHVKKINDNTHKNGMTMSEIIPELSNTLAIDNGRKSVINSTTTEKVSAAQHSLNRTFEIVEDSNNNTYTVKNVTLETASEVFNNLGVSNFGNFTSSTMAENNLITQNSLNETLQNDEDNSNSILRTLTTSSAVENGQESITSSTTTENDLVAQDIVTKTFQYIGHINNSAFESGIVTSVTAPEFSDTFAVNNGNEGFISSSTTEQVTVSRDTRNENNQNVEEINNITFENEIITSVPSSEFLDTLTVDNGQENLISISTTEHILIVQDTINNTFQNTDSNNSANQVVIVTSLTAPDVRNTMAIENGEKPTSTTEAENVSVTQISEIGISHHGAENNNATYKVNKTTSTIIPPRMNTLAVTNSQENVINGIKTETTKGSVNENDTTYTIGTKTSTEAPEVSHTLSVDNGQNVTYRPIMLNFTKNQTISEINTERNSVVNITMVTPQELNISSINDLPKKYSIINEDLGTKIIETVPNHQFSEIATNEYVIETTTVIQYTSNPFAANAELQITSSAPTSVEPVQNVEVTDKITSVTTMLPLKTLNDSEIGNLQEVIPSEATTETRVIETLRNKGTVRNVANIEGAFETTTAALVGNKFSEIYIDQQFANKPFFKNISTNKEVLEEVIGKDVTLTNSSVSVTINTDAAIFDGSQVINNDQSVIENGVSNNIQNVTTQGYMVETAVSESEGLTVSIKDNLGAVLKNIINSTTEKETQFDVTSESQNTAAKRTEVTVQFQDIITQMKSSVEETDVKESTLINEMTDSTGVTKSSDLINTVTSNEEIMLEGSHYQTLPFITSFDKHKNQGTTISTRDFSSFVGTGLQSEGISVNEGWLVLNDGDTTTENIFITVTNKTKMPENSLISKSDITTLSSLADENNRVITGMFANLAEQITPSNNRFTVKNIQDKESTVAGSNIENNPWDPSDGLLMHMPNVVFELDKNTDSLSIDETSYLGHGQKTTGPNNAFSILSETIPHTINKQGATSENVIETGASYVAIRERASDILGTGVNKSLHHLGNTEKNTITDRSQTGTESITVPVKRSNEQFIQNNSTESVTKINISILGITSEKNGQSTSTETNGFLSEKESYLIGNITNGDTHLSIDIQNFSLLAPARDENQYTLNKNNNMTTKKQTQILETSTVPIQPSFDVHNYTTYSSATGATKKNIDAKAIGRDHLEGPDFTMTPLLLPVNAQETIRSDFINSSIIVDVNKDFTLESSSKVSSNKIEYSGASTDTEARDDVQSNIEINTNTETVISQQTTKSTEILSDNPRKTTTEETSSRTSHGILDKTTASAVIIKSKEQNIFQVNSDKKSITSAVANSSRQGEITSRPSAVNRSLSHTDKIEVGGDSTDTDVPTNIQINNNTVLKQQSTKSIHILPNKPREISVKETSFRINHDSLDQMTAGTVIIENPAEKLSKSAIERFPKQRDIGQSTLTAGVDMSILNENKSVVEGVNTEDKMVVKHASSRIPTDSSRVNENLEPALYTINRPPRVFSVQSRFSTQELPTSNDNHAEQGERRTKSLANVTEKVAQLSLATSPKSPMVTKAFASILLSGITTENIAGMADGQNIKHEIDDANNDNGEVTKSLQTTSTPPTNSVENFYENTQATVSLTTIPSSQDNITRHIIKTVSSDILPAGSTSTVTAKSEKNKNESSAEIAALGTNAYGFDCTNVVRGRFSDNFDCRKFYICIDKTAIVGFCPYNTVFSPIKKQCTKNLSHCIRGEEFQCTAQGRFIDILRENIYYICVKNSPAFIRFKFQCQNGFILNKSTIRCERILVSPVTASLLLVSKKGRTQSSQVSKKVLEKRVNKQKSRENNSSDVSKKDSEQSSDVPKKDVKKSNSDEPLEEKAELEEKSKSRKCTREGKIPHPDDCRKYYVCYKNKKSELRRKRKKCDSDELFDSNKSKCVDSESYECNLG